MTYSHEMQDRSDTKPQQSTEPKLCRTPARQSPLHLYIQLWSFQLAANFIFSKQTLKLTTQLSQTSPKYASALASV